MAYPDIEDPDFYKKINKKFNKYLISEKKLTFDQICYPKNYELQPQQNFLGVLMGPKTQYSGLLVYHSIGSGKTASAIKIAEENKNKLKIIIVLPASLKGNFRKELRTPAAGDNYISYTDRKKLTELHPTSNKYLEIIKESDDKINKVYTIYSYNKFVDLCVKKELNLSKTLLIIDEIQNMVSETGVYYEVLYDAIHSAPENLKVIVLSATPIFDKPVEIALTMNLLRIPFTFPIGKEFDKMFIKVKTDSNGNYTYHAQNLDLFKKCMKGYVSYFRGAPPYVFPELTIKYVKCNMSEFQYDSYKMVLLKEKKKIRDKYASFKKSGILHLPNNFFLGTRLISNVAFPNRHINGLGLQSLVGSAATKFLHKYSIKFFKILKKIKSTIGKIFIYSNFKTYGGIQSLTQVLEQNGYLNYYTHGVGPKRFGIFSGDKTTLEKDELISVYNNSKNINGSKIKLLIGSPSIKEGVSLVGVKQAHILDVSWNLSKMRQIIGRVSRFCSHKMLEEDKRNVKIYIYVATYINKNTVDEYIVQLARKKQNLIDEFEKAIKESAIDCELFKSANVHGEEEDIKCVL